MSEIFSSSSQGIEYSLSDLNEGTFIKLDQYEVTNSSILIKIVNICDLSHFMSHNYFYMYFANNSSNLF